MVNIIVKLKWTEAQAAQAKAVSHWNSDLGRNARVCIKYNKNTLVYYLLSLPLRR